MRNHSTGWSDPLVQRTEIRIDNEITRINFVRGIGGEKGQWENSSSFGEKSQDGREGFTVECNAVRPNRSNARFTKLLTEF